MSGKGHLAGSDVDVLAMVLVGPSSVVSQYVSSFHNVKASSDLKRSIIVANVNTAVVPKRKMGVSDSQSKPFRCRESRGRTVRRRWPQ
jgi:hypothetical protein